MVVASTVGSGVVRRVVFLIFVVVVVRMLVVVVVVVVIVIDVVVVVEINGVVEVIVVGVLLVVRVLVLDVLMVGSIGRVAVSSKKIEFRNQICYTNLEFPLLVLEQAECQYQHLKNIFRETISDEFQMFKTCFKLSLTNLIFLTGVWFRRYTKLTKYIKIATFLAKFAADKDLT